MAARVPKTSSSLLAGQLVRQLTVKDGDTLPEKADGFVRLVCVSDTHNQHGKLPALPAGDILVHAGDFSNTGGIKDILSFSSWLDKQPFEHKLVIAGNHDTTFHPDYYHASGHRFHRSPIDCAEARAALTNCTYLEDSGVSIMGLNFWGSPWQPEFCDWAFNLPRGSALADKWALIPDDTDVLITHGPPWGHGDLCSSWDRAGCIDLLTAVEQRVRPKAHIFGHIHEGYGMSTDGTTLFVNASTCTLRYRPVQKPIVIDVPIAADAWCAEIEEEGEVVVGEEAATDDAGGGERGGGGGGSGGGGDCSLA
eukprot:PLAT14632.1.p1 GENE.PLAT14632.1~~PLAT14632.1.p1  ORF type:complete len:324 (+),score=85.68 PLAT14632.1:47-973(+)